MKVKKPSISQVSVSFDTFSGFSELVCITDTSGNILYVNPALEKRAQSGTVILGKPGLWNDVILSDFDNEFTPQQFNKVYSPLLNGLFDLRVYCSGGVKNKPSVIWIAKDADPDKLKLSADPKKKIRKAANDLYHTLFETSPSGILLMDEKGNIIDVNQAMCSSTGYNPSELIGQHVSILALPENFNHIAPHIKQILSGKILKHEVTSRRKDGSFYYSLLVESAVIMPDGKLAVLSVSNDISERKRAEVALRDSEVWFKAIANYTANWESMFSAEGRIVWTNPAAERFTGYSPDEIIAMPDFIDELVARPDRAKAKEVLLTALRESEGQDHFFRCIRKDGTFFWLSIAWTHIRDEKGNLIGIRTSGQDVTLRLEATHALKNSENIYRQMIENAPFGMHFFEMDDQEHLIFTHANPVADSILQIDHSRLSGKKIEDAFPSLKGTDAPKKYLESARNNQTWITEKLFLNSADNAMSFEVKAFQTVPGKMVAIFADITKRIHAEEQLRESRQLFETLARMAPVGIFRTNEKGDTTFVNPKWSALCGLSYAEALQNKYVSAIHPDDREERIKEWKYSVKHKIPVISEYRFIRPDGSIIWVQGQAIPEMADGQVRGYIGTITDITELIETQNDLRAAKEKAEASNSLKTTFMKNLSHEIRTPLNGIFGFAQLLGSGDYTPQENQEFVGFLELSITRMTKTIDNTMELSLLMTGNMHKNDALFNIGSLMQEIYRTYKPIAEKKNLEFVLKATLTQALMVISDRMMVKRIVEEIADNAVKFTDTGKVSIDYRIEDSLLKIVIRDTGQGITQDYLPLIFEPFMQENVFSARAHNSTGLGLSIVHGLTSLLGGSIKAESKLGKGTSISLVLPVRLNSIIPAVQSENVRLSDESEKVPEILIVEDEQINMLFVKRLLGKYKCKLIEATSGKDAIAEVKKNPAIDIILMDIRMPGMDGYQAIEIIHDINPSAKIAAVTAYGGASDREACFDAGCIDYLAKPFHSKDLFTMLRRVIQWPPEEK
jgi:PAS domain S-box-containing protein